MRKILYCSRFRKNCTEQLSSFPRSCLLSAEIGLKPGKYVSISRVHVLIEAQNTKLLSKKTGWGEGFSSSGCSVPPTPPKAIWQTELLALAILAAVFHLISPSTDAQSNCACHFSDHSATHHSPEAMRISHLTGGETKAGRQVLNPHLRTLSHQRL